MFCVVQDEFEDIFGYDIEDNDYSLEQLDEDLEKKMSSPECIKALNRAIGKIIAKKSEKN